MGKKKNSLINSTTFNNMQISFVTLTILIGLVPMIKASYNNYPSYGFSYVDSGGHYINVKFGTGLQMSNSNVRSNYASSNAIPYERKLFTPILREFDVVSDGQYEEYVKFIKEAEEEDAKEALKNTESSSQAYVSVKLGNDSYNYQY